MSNPVFNENAFRAAQERQTALKSGVMTLNGTVNKTFLLLFICLCGAMLGWAKPETFVPFTWAVLIAAFVIVLVISFKPNVAGLLSPVYAFLQGIFLGVISLAFQTQYQGIVLSAVGVTLAVFFVMLFIYRTGIIKVTPGFTRVILSATLGIVIFYAIALLYSAITHRPSVLASKGPLSIGISVVVCAVAAFNFMLDFNFIEKASASGSAPKYFEWYGAFGLMVTLIWLYLEILRLLSKFQRR